MARGALLQGADTSRSAGETNVMKWTMCTEGHSDDGHSDQGHSEEANIVTIHELEVNNAFITDPFAYAILFVSSIQYYKCCSTLFV